MSWFDDHVVKYEPDYGLNDNEELNELRKKGIDLALDELDLEEVEIEIKTKTSGSDDVIDAESLQEEVSDGGTDLIGDKPRKQ